MGSDGHVPSIGMSLGAKSAEMSLGAADTSVRATSVAKAVTMARQDPWQGQNGETS